MASSAGSPAGLPGRSLLRVRSVGLDLQDGRARGGRARCECTTPCGLRVQPQGGEWSAREITINGTWGHPFGKAYPESRDNADCAVPIISHPYTRSQSGTVSTAHSTKYITPLPLTQLAEFNNLLMLRDEIVHNTLQIPITRETHYPLCFTPHTCAVHHRFHHRKQVVLYTRFRVWGALNRNRCHLNPLNQRRRGPLHK